MEKLTEPACDDPEIRQARITCLLEEYRVMYGLVEFRMTSLDRRVPIAGATLTATLASTAALPHDPLMIVFLGLPLALVWFLRTTINHARSFEDVLRRIERIEQEVNGLLGRETICFQSRHPSRGRLVGGRTGNETIGAVWVTVITLLAGCGFMFVQIGGTSREEWISYGAFLAIIMVHSIFMVVRLGRYTYDPK